MKALGRDGVVLGEDEVHGEDGRGIEKIKLGQFGLRLSIINLSRLDGFKSVSTFASFDITRTALK